MFRSTFLPGLAAAVVSAIVIGCGSHHDGNRFVDPVQRHIADLQDRRRADSLVSYLYDLNAAYRKEAALALASVQDTTVAGELGSLLLEDQDPGVRAAAAFALGQTGSFAAANALIPALQDEDPEVRYHVRVALGKTITAHDFSSLVNDEATDTSSTRGLAWAIFHIGSRKLADSTIVTKALRLVGSTDVPTQLGAAHFFSRSTYPPQDGVQPAITRLLSSPDPEVRMAAAFAIRKFVNAESLAAINDAIYNDPDYRVRINAIRGLQGFEWPRVSDLYRKGLADSNNAVVVAAAEALRQRKGYTADEVSRMVKDCKSWRAAAVLTEVMLTLDPSRNRVRSVKLSTIKDPYQLAATIDALGSAPVAYPMIVDKLFSSNDKVVQSTAASALVKINRNPAFTAAMQKEFAGIYQRAIAQGDQGVILHVCEALADSTLGYRDVIKNIDFLKAAKEKLSLPKDYETLVPLERAIAWFEGGPAPKSPVNQYNHPIDWSVVAKLPSDQKMLIRTSKGDITIRLLVDEAPGSVVNFVKLAEANYFNEKFFHRVVPNFVIQAGCNRGDGFGSEDYSIRSEFAMRTYTTGSVGMASAGKDTEGTQWFITHSPTPHLDGKYTIFAEVLNGQQVVDAIEVGDQIVSASLVKN